MVIVSCTLHCMEHIIMVYGIGILGVFLFLLLRFCSRPSLMEEDCFWIEQYDLKFSSCGLFTCELCVQLLEVLRVQEVVLSIVSPSLHLPTTCE
jgi:hypothetical protein